MTTTTPNRSARILGEEYRLTAPEMNLALKQLGFLEGEPSAYRVTEKGLPFAIETFHHAGTGGSPWYNRYWDTRTWRASITDHIHMTDELRQTVRAEAAALRQQAAAARAAARLAEDVPASPPAAVQGIDSRRLAIGIGVVLAVGATAYGVWKGFEWRRQRRAGDRSSSPG